MVGGDLDHGPDGARPFGRPAVVDQLATGERRTRHLVGPRRRGGVVDRVVEHGGGDDRPSVGDRDAIGVDQLADVPGHPHDVIDGVISTMRLAMPFDQTTQQLPGQTDVLLPGEVEFHLGAAHHTSVADASGAGMLDAWRS